MRHAGRMRPRTQIISRSDYCRYLLVSRVNYTSTDFADHGGKFSHDALKRRPAGDRPAPGLIREHIGEQPVQTARGFVVFDDTVPVTGDIPAGRSRPAADTAAVRTV